MSRLLTPTQGAALAVGQTIDLIGGADTIIGFRPYTGPLDWGGPARVAALARGREITIAADQRFDVVTA
jgi:hypothetical protein